VQALKQENEELQTRLTDAPQQDLGNLEEIRDRVLATWKVAKRAESKDRISEALDKFIRHYRETIKPSD
jgi:hypothetical protein